MTLRTQAKKIVAAVALSVAACGASAASIQTHDLLDLRSGAGGELGPSDLYAGVSYGFRFNLDDAYTSGGGYAGILDLEAAHFGDTDWRRVLAFCLEPGSSFGYNSPFKVVANISNDVKRMWATHFDGIDTDEEAAAFQVAIWELVWDTETTDLDDGLFKLTTDGVIRTQALAYLDGESWDNALANLVRLQDNQQNSPDRQDLVIDVPTPTSLALFALGLIGLGTVRRRTGKA
jgi:hypothetical protein